MRNQQPFLLAILILVAAGSGGAEIQPLSFEESVRQQLRKIDSWGLRRLLETQQQIDKKQKERARLSTNPRELVELAGDEDSEVRFFVAVNHYTPLEVLQNLAADPETQVRSGVAMALAFQPLGPRSDLVIIEEMARALAVDSQVLVRMKLAENTDLPPGVFDQLAVDPDHLVRLHLAQNANVSPSALSALAQDAEEAVLVSSLGHRNMPLEWLEKSADQPSALIRLAVAKNINTPVGVLNHLSTDQAVEVRRAVAHHTNTSLKTLDKMRADNDLEVLLAIVAHPRADRKLLMKLARDDRDGGVRLAAQQRLVPLLRKEIREDLLERWRTQ